MNIMWWKRRGCAVHLPVFFIVLCIIGSDPRAQSREQTISSLQEYLQNLRSWKAEFRQTFNSGGIRQEESGTLWLKKPGRMRWEYHEPENKVFVADGKKTYFFVPADNQVSIREFTEEDLKYTAFGFLIGGGNLSEDFDVSEVAGNPESLSLRVLELAPRRPFENVASMALEFDPTSNQISSLTVREYTGGISRFEFTQIEENPRLSNQFFRFKISKGVEVIRIEEP